MASVSFHLNRSDSDKPTAIYISFYTNGKQLKIQTGESIPSSQWDKAEQKAKTRNRPENETLNKNLARMGNQVLEFYNNSVANGILPTIEQLRNAVEPAATTDTTPAITLYDAFGEFIEQARQQGRARSATAYETARTHLYQFGTYAKMPVSFEGLTLPFFDKYIGWMLTQLNITDNTVAKHLNNLKTFLKWATDRGYNENQTFRKANHTRRDPAIIALTANELQLLEQVNLAASPHLNNARNLFLIMAYTGLRYSDLAALRPEYDRGNHLEITAQKTGRPATPLVLPKTRPLLAALFTGSIHVIANQKLNQYIKEAARLAGIDANTEKLEFRGGKRIAKYFPKWQLIGCHTGRRTYVTQMLMKGYDNWAVMPTTGHKDVKSFARYVDYSKENLLSKFASLLTEETPPQTPEPSSDSQNQMRIAV